MALYRSSIVLLLACCAVFPSEALVPPAVVHTAIGAVAGSAGAIAAYPFDYVKSQLQTEEGRDKYDGGVQAAFEIVKSHGPLALYRGAMVNVVGVAPEKTIKLSVNDAMRAMVRAHFGHLPIVGEVFAGGIAGMTQVIVTNPLEVVKVKMQTSSLSLKEVTQQLKGIVDMYEGVEACVARDMVFSATLFPLYAHAKVALSAFLVASMGGVDAGAATFWANLVAGSLAAAPAAFVSTPADVIKTRIQQARKEQLVPAMTVDYTATGTSDSFMGVASSIVKHEGPEVLLSGWFERVVRSAPQFGVTLAMFDVLTTWAIEHHYLLPEGGI